MTGFITGAALLICNDASQIPRWGLICRVRTSDEIRNCVVDNYFPCGPGLRSALPCQPLYGLYCSKRLRPRWPNYLLALLGGNTVYLGLGGRIWTVATIWSIPSVISCIWKFRNWAFGRLRRIWPSPAFAIAIGWLLEAMVLQSRCIPNPGQDISSKREFVGRAFPCGG